jgi:hypothetical protein
MDVMRLARVALLVSSVFLVVAASPSVVRKFRSNDAATARTIGPLGKPRVASGTEVILYFIASSTCGASRHPSLPQAMQRIHNRVADSVKAQNKRVVYVGVGVDENPTASLDFLKQYGPFDEVIAGGSWLGTGAVDLLIRGLPGPLVLPQLLIVERDVEAGKKAISVSADRVQARKLGFQEILTMAGISTPDSTR